MAVPFLLLAMCVYVVFLAIEQRFQSRVWSDGGVMYVDDFHCGLAIRMCLQPHDLLILGWRDAICDS